MSEKSCKDCSHYVGIIGGMYEDYCLMSCFTIEEPTRIAKACPDYTLKEMTQKESDPIKPDHYKQGKLTCNEVCEAMCINREGIEAAYVFNITKYIYRYNMKDGIKDVRKAKEYCDFLIAHLENNVAE